MRNIDESAISFCAKDSGKRSQRWTRVRRSASFTMVRVYMHDGVAYRVTKLDLESRTAYAVPFNGSYYTVAGEANVKIVHE